jgi:hypothetical protein
VPPGFNSQATTGSDLISFVKNPYGKVKNVTEFNSNRLFVCRHRLHYCGTNKGRYGYQEERRECRSTSYLYVRCWVDWFYFSHVDILGF